MSKILKTVIFRYFQFFHLTPFLIKGEMVTFPLEGRDGGKKYTSIALELLMKTDSHIKLN